MISAFCMYITSKISSWYKAWNVQWLAFLLWLRQPRFESWSWQRPSGLYHGKSVNISPPLMRCTCLLINVNGVWCAHIQHNMIIKLYDSDPQPSPRISKVCSLGCDTTEPINLLPLSYLVNVCIYGYRNRWLIHVFMPLVIVNQWIYTRNRCTT